jgi:hypothetical protein
MLFLPTLIRPTAIFPLLIVLARIFHTDRDEEAAKADGVRQASISMPGCMCPYCPNQNGSLTQHPSDFPDSVVDEYEIGGLVPHTISTSAIIFLQVTISR